MPTDPNKPRRRRNRVTALKIGEISAVDFPAQEPALAVAIKSAEGESVQAYKLAELLTSETSGHQHGVRIYFYDGEVRVYIDSATSTNSDTPHDHAVALDDQGNLVIGLSEGHTHTVSNEALQSALISALSCKFAEPSAEQRSGEQTTEETIMAKAKKSAFAEAFEALDEEAQSAFLADAANESAKRKEAEDAAKAADPANAEVAALKAQVAEMKEADEARKAADLGMPVATFKALSSIEDEADRAAAFKSFADGKAASDYLGKPLGTAAGGDPAIEEMSASDANKKLDELVAAASKEGTSKSETMKQVYRDNPELVSKARSA